jgi:hypothetical protein
MLTGFRVLWRALIHFWDESLLMIRANVTWFVVSLPLYLLTVLATGLLLAFLQAFLPAAPVESAEALAEGEGSAIPWLLAALVLVLIPQPISAGVYAITNFVTNEETPEFSLFWRAIKLLWKRTLVMYLIGAGVFGGLIFNTAFYMASTTGLLQAVSILWLYGIVYWLSLQAYLLPLLVTAAIPPPPPPTGGEDGWPLEEGQQRNTQAPPPAPTPEILPLGTLYKRAAILALANPIMSLVMLFGVLLGLALSSFALPVYPLIVMSFTALIGCRGLRTLREKYFPSEAQGAAG